MKITLHKLFLIFFIFFQFEAIAEEKNYHKELITDWSRIFPDQNRNAAGPKFFKYIIDKKITYKDFIEFNKLYCAVSGSLIDPNSEPDFLFAKEIKTNEKICGDYYKCCIPCSCDIMKYSEVDISWEPAHFLSSIIGLNTGEGAEVTSTSYALELSFFVIATRDAQILHSFNSKP